jgi:hypothetical protein
MRVTLGLLGSVLKIAEGEKLDQNDPLAKWATKKSRLRREFDLRL